MSEHDEIADKREAELNYMEAESDRNVDRAEEARDALEQAGRDELVPTALGEHDPAHREAPEGEGEPTAADERGDDESEGKADIAPGDPSDQEPPSEDQEDPARPNA